MNHYTHHNRRLKFTLDDLLGPRPESPKLIVPDDAPCNTTYCVHASDVGSSVCRNTCPYYQELKKLADAGELETVEG